MASALKYGIISDIHANYVALRGVLNYFHAERVDRVLCLGDLVGSGDEPLNCIDLIRKTPNVSVVAGCHDRQLFGEKDPRRRGRSAASMEWTAEHLNAEQSHYLRELPRILEVDGIIVMVHDSLTEQDGYILTPQEMNRNLQMMVADHSMCKVCFFGHSHLSMLISTKTVRVIGDAELSVALPLDRSERYLINPGSVGQPRDGCSKASFAIFDAKDWTVSFMRVGYG